MNLEQRIDRLDAAEAMRQIACRYAVAIDARATDLIAELYVDDVRVGAAQGRAALRAEFDRVLRSFTTSVHQILGHVIEFDDADNARGIVTCRADHEVDGQWVSILMHYHDRYQRRGGRWYLRGRVQGRLCATASDDPPVGENKMRWPGARPSPGNFHDAFPSWTTFWGNGEQDNMPEAGPAYRDAFITRLRGSTKLPPPPGDFM